MPPPVAPPEVWASVSRAESTDRFDDDAEVGLLGEGPEEGAEEGAVEGAVEVSSLEERLVTKSSMEETLERPSSRMIVLAAGQAVAQYVDMLTASISGYILEPLQ